MGIKKRVNDHANPGHKKTITVPAFSFAPTDALAQVILDAWASPAITATLMGRTNQGFADQAAYTQATTMIRHAGIDLERAVIISEEEHDNDYTMESDFEVVFVLPDEPRVHDRTHTGQPLLLQTAKLLMACTPNGI